MIKYSWQETGDKVYAFQQWNIIGTNVKRNALSNIILVCLKQKNIHDPTYKKFTSSVQTNLCWENNQN